MNGPAVLVGDVGGTNARFAIARVGAGGQVALERIASVPVAGRNGLAAVLGEWAAAQGLEVRDVSERAVLALAGPTGADEIRFTNLGWTVRAADMRQAFGLADVRLVNDFAAQARAMPGLPAEAFETLIEGAADPGMPQAVLGPGTGLGLAILAPRGGDWIVIPGEGGHQAFAPCNARERAVLALAAEELGYVCFEHLVSGPGLARLHRIVKALDGHAPGPAADPAAIGAAAVAGSDPAAFEAARLLAEMAATFAGNAVLAAGAKGGCILAGGVSAALAPFFRSDGFRRRFVERGVQSRFMCDIPVRRALDPHAALRGAALFAPGAMEGA